MKVLIFGGSFDPPHAGHAALLRAAARQLEPDRILIVPAYQAPLKGTPGASATDRLGLLRLGLLGRLPRALKKKTRLELSELTSRRKVYTVETLARLKRRRPDDELHFVVGSDAAASFPRWKEPARLRRLCRWWTAARPGEARPPAHFSRVLGRMPDVSSTELRRRLARGEETSGLDARVASRIARRGLYGARLARELKRRLKPERFEHVLNVAALAEELAARWGLDAEKARLAGLLHDLGRSVPAAKMPAYARRHRVKVPALDEIAARNPLLAHAHISAHLARRLGYRDPEILSAVRKHTLGAARMSRLDRLLFVADACSRDRAYPGVARLRRLAFEDLDRAFAAVVENKLGHVAKSGAWLHPCARSLWNSLKK